MYDKVDEKPKRSQVCPLTWAIFYVGSLELVALMAAFGEETLGYPVVAGTAQLS